MEKAPLKLKLKLGSTPEPPFMETDPPVAASEEEDEKEGVAELDLQNPGVGADDAGKDRQHKKSKKKKKKKDRHRHKRERGPEEEGDVEESKRARCSEAPPTSPALVAAAFKELLTHLLSELEKFDTNQFFIDPVTDMIAPGYSSIITQPMCFIAMREKVAEGLYSSLQQYESDVKLIVTNCLKYNGPDTVYYSAGKRLLTAAHSVLSRDKLLALRKDIPGIAILPPEAIGFPLVAGHCGDPDSGGDDRSESPNSQDSRSDDEEEEDGTQEAAFVAQQAQAAARAAATALHRRKPTSTMGYLKPRADGSVGLSFLSGCEGTDAGSSARRGESKPLNLGLVIGKLTAGTSTLNNFHDDKRTMAKPVKPIIYGSYSSFCPSYDSTFANLSKEESDLVRATYGNETAVQYAESICDFSRDCSMATTLVDQLLDLLTSGQHSRTRSNISESHTLQQHRLEQQKQEDVKEDIPVVDSTPPDFGKLRSLSSLGIDIGFIDSFEKASAAATSATNALNGAAELVQSLASEQSERLGKQSAQASLVPSQPTHNEINLAERLQSELVSAARHLPPAALLPQPGLQL